jgi:hypothetical protein
MPPHQGFERPGVLPRPKALQELIVRQVFRPYQMSNAAQNNARLCLRHVRGPYWTKDIVPV